MVNFFLHLLPLIYSIFVCVDPNPTKLLNIRLQFGSGFTTLLQTLVNRDSCNYLFGWPEPWGLTSQVDRSHYQHLRWKNCENQSGPAVTGRAFKLYRYKYKFYFSSFFTGPEERCAARVAEPVGNALLLLLHRRYVDFLSAVFRIRIISQDQDPYQKIGWIRIQQNHWKAENKSQLGWEIFVVVIT